MATIRKLRGRWQAMVRRKGMQPRAKSFDQKADAEKWARTLEGEIDKRGALPDTRAAESTTLAQVLTRYRDDVSPSKRGFASEIARLNGVIRRPIAFRTLATLTSADLSDYREQRLKVVAPATVVREINLVSHAIDTARKDWGVYMPDNPCALVRRPKPPRGRTRRLHEGEELRLLKAGSEGRSAYRRRIHVPTSPITQHLCRIRLCRQLWMWTTGLCRPTSSV